MKAPYCWTLHGHEFLACSFAWKCVLHVNEVCMVGSFLFRNIGEGWNGDKKTCCGFETPNGRVYKLETSSNQIDSITPKEKLIHFLTTIRACKWREHPMLDLFNRLWTKEKKRERTTPFFLLGSVLPPFPFLLKLVFSHSLHFGIRLFRSWLSLHEESCLSLEAWVMYGGVLARNVNLHDGFWHEH